MHLLPRKPTGHTHALLPYPNLSCAALIYYKTCIVSDENSRGIVGNVRKRNKSVLSSKTHNLAWTSVQKRGDVQKNGTASLPALDSWRCDLGLAKTRSQIIECQRWDLSAYLFEAFCFLPVIFSNLPSSPCACTSFCVSDGRQPVTSVHKIATSRTHTTPVGWKAKFNTALYSSTLKYITVFTYCKYRVI